MGGTHRTLRRLTTSGINNMGSMGAVCPICTEYSMSTWAAMFCNKLRQHGVEHKGRNNTMMHYPCCGASEVIFFFASDGSGAAQVTFQCCSSPRVVSSQACRLAATSDDWALEAGTPQGE